MWYEEEYKEDKVRIETTETAVETLEYRKVVW